MAGATAVGGGATTYGGSTANGNDVASNSCGAAARRGVAATMLRGSPVMLRGKCSNVAGVGAGALGADDALGTRDGILERTGCFLFLFLCFCEWF
jgi:hypothetical protein